MIALFEKNPKSRVIVCIIYNKYERLHQIALNGCASIISLIKILCNNAYQFTYQCHKKNNVTSFFAHIKYFKLAKKYTSSIVMDCTYKTNQF